MRILALEPFYTGSHQAFLDNWRHRSRHTFTCLTLPGRLWKWRMRHAAFTFAEQLQAIDESDRNWDCLFASAMLNLAEFRGLAGPEMAALPAVLYFHENQFSYPVQDERDRDLHFALTNLTSILASDMVWFNSEFHRQEFASSLTEFVSRMPEYAPRRVLEELAARAAVQSPGAVVKDESGPRPEGPLHIVWVGRWEYDKNPEQFFEVLIGLQQAGVSFQVSALGESYSKRPPIFDKAREQLAASIRHWGYADDRAVYERVLHEADVVVSTAIHEFFGIAVIEAIMAGCYPLLPNRLSYPELLDVARNTDSESYLYGESNESLAGRIRELVSMKENAAAVYDAGRAAREAVSRYGWSRRVAAMDDAIAGIRDLDRAE